MTAMKEKTLRQLGSRLILILSEVAIRGNGDSLFLYVVGNGKSAEVSWNGDQLWVEFWNSLEEDAPPISDATFDQIEDVEAALVERLS